MLADSRTHMRRTFICSASWIYQKLLLKGKEVSKVEGFLFEVAFAFMEAKLFECRADVGEGGVSQEGGEFALIARGEQRAVGFWAVTHVERRDGEGREFAEFQ